MSGSKITILGHPLMVWTRLLGLVLLGKILIWKILLGMALPVVEFSRQGYKIGKVFA